MTAVVGRFSGGNENFTHGYHLLAFVDLLYSNATARVTPIDTPHPIPHTTDNSTVYNDTEDMSEKADFKVAVRIWQICPVILFIAGTFGNSAILLTLRHMRLGRTSMTIYLRGLALSDMCALYTGLFRWWLKWTFQTDIRVLHVAMCKIHTWLVHVSLSISTWILVVMTLERMFSTCMPHRVASCCTTRRAIHLILFLVIVQGVIYSHLLFGLTLIQEEDELYCDAVPGEYHYIVHHIWPFVDICILSLLPFICLAVGNITIVWKTFVSLKTAEGMSIYAGNGSHTNRRRKRASTMTVILLSLSGLFLFSTSPVCVFNLWERGYLYGELSKTPEGMARIELIWAIVTMAMYCNNTFNFYLYCLTGKKFRFEMFRRLTRQRRSESTSNNLSGPSLHRFAVLNDGNRFQKQSYREVTPLRSTSVKFSNSRSDL